VASIGQWVAGARPRTLPTAVSPVLVGTGAAVGAGAVEPLRAVLACELVAAVRALRMRGLPVPAQVAGLPDDRADRDLTGDLQLACTLLDVLGAPRR
jgi:hypothetical protein